VQQVPVVSEIPEAETQTLEADAEVSAHSDEASKSKDTPNEPHEPDVAAPPAPTA